MKFLRFTIFTRQISDSNCLVKRILMCFEFDSEVKDKKKVWLGFVLLQILQSVVLGVLVVFCLIESKLKTFYVFVA